MSKKQRIKELEKQLEEANEKIRYLEMQLRIARGESELWPVVTVDGKTYYTEVFMQ